MTTEAGVEFARKRLREGSNSLESLRATWHTIAPAYQAHPDVLGLKNELRDELEGKEA